MQAPRFLHTLLTSSLPLVHAKRLQALLDTVGALLGERRLGLTALGRALPGPVATKHTIKRVDRFAGQPSPASGASPVLLARGQPADWPHDPPADSGGLVAD